MIEQDKLPIKEHDKGETERMRENSPKGWALDTVSGYQGKKEKKLKAMERKKLWKHSPWVPALSAFLVLPKFQSCFYITENALFSKTKSR